MLPQSRPSMRTAPSSGRSSRPATCSNVDLPAPDGPTRATLSPLASRSEIRRSTSRLSPACLNVRTTDLSSSTGSLIAERFDGIEPRRAPGRIERRQERQAEGHGDHRSEEHTSELQSQFHLVCRLLLEKKKHQNNTHLTLHTESQP